MMVRVFALLLVLFIAIPTPGLADDEKEKTTQSTTYRSRACKLAYAVIVGGIVATTGGWFLENWLDDNVAPVVYGEDEDGKKTTDPRTQPDKPGKHIVQPQPQPDLAQKQRMVNLRQELTAALSSLPNDNFGKQARQQILEEFSNQQGTDQELRDWWANRIRAAIEQRDAIINGRSKR